MSDLKLKIPKMMRAVAIFKALPVTDVNCLKDIELPVPETKGNDLLVQIRSISINPIDTKIRLIKEDDNIPKIVGYDASGVVVDIGEKVNKFKPGDEVYFSGDFSRPGSYGQYMLVEEDIVGFKPKTFSFEEAAAVPVGLLTAWETIYDRLLVNEKDKGKSILIINSAGGVGSLAVQLAKRAGLTVIGTASRQSSKDWAIKYGADHIINHREDVPKQLKELGFEFVDLIVVNFDAYPYWNVLEDVIAPQGRICLVVDTSQPVDLRAFKKKSVTIVSELMMTRVLFNTPDKVRHHEILNEASKLFDEGKLKGTLARTLSPFCAEIIRGAHQIIENKESFGKLVITNFS